MFTMFLHSPPASTPATTVYRERRPFGPFGRLAGDVAAPPANSGFSRYLLLEVDSSRPVTYRELRTVCDGVLRVGEKDPAHASATDAPRIVTLTPWPTPAYELGRIAEAAEIESPVAFEYLGVDPNELEARIAPLVEAAPNPTGLTIADRIREVIEQGVPIKVNKGFTFGTTSAHNNEDGWHALGFRVLTLDQNALDPVTLFNELVASSLSSGQPAVAASEATNSWMEVATRDRILLTFRDEWNRPWVGPGTFGTVQGSTATELEVQDLTTEQAGTLVLPDGWDAYSPAVGAPGSRKLTPMPSDSAAADQAVFNASAPNHRVIGVVRPADWFERRNPLHPTAPDGLTGAELSHFTEGNLATPLIDGISTFAKLYEDLKELEDANPSSGSLPENFAVLADWFLDVDFQLVPGRSGSTVYELLTAAVWSPHHVIVRALASGTPPDQNREALERVELLDTLREDYTNSLQELVGPVHGTFHWKFSIVRNRKGTFAQLGGVDLNPNRLDDHRHKPGGREYHDVHLRLQGPAVEDVLTSFQLRWNLNQGTGDPITDSLTATTATPSGAAATHIVQIARTHPAPAYGDWPEGDRTIWGTLRRALRRARRYIYIEDQYLVAPMLRDELHDALAREPELEVVIVFPRECDHGLPPGTSFAQRDCDRARSIFLKNLMEHPRVQVFEIRKYFVHSKVVIVDDVFATIGSANMNRRGLTFDREINAFVLDGRVERGRRKFARDLRTRLWAEHLGLPLSNASFRRLEDVRASLSALRGRHPHSSRLERYPQNVRHVFGYAAGWDTISDPDGR